MAGTATVKKYGSLRVLSTAIAWLGHLLALLFVIVIFFVVLNGQDAVGIVRLAIGLQIVGLALFGAAVWLIFMAISDVILVVIDIEENTRRAASSGEP